MSVLSHPGQEQSFPSSEKQKCSSMVPGFLHTLADAISLVPLSSYVTLFSCENMDETFMGLNAPRSWAVSVLIHPQTWQQMKEIEGRVALKVFILDKYLSYSAAISNAGNCSLSIICCIWQGRESGLLQKIAWLISGEQHKHTIIKEQSLLNAFSPFSWLSQVIDY